MLCSDARFQPDAEMLLQRSSFGRIIGLGISKIGSSVITCVQFLVVFIFITASSKVENASVCLKIDNFLKNIYKVVFLLRLQDVSISFSPFITPKLEIIIILTSFG